MMNKHIRNMIDEIFSEMKMTAENLALRDELLANAQARFEDAVAAGKSEDDAFIEVAASLGDVQELLDEMNASGQATAPAAETVPFASQEKTIPQSADDAAAQPQADETEMPEENAEEKGHEGNGQPFPGTNDLGDALNKAFAALEGFSQSIMPEAKKFVRQVDDATGGMIRGFGKAAQKGFKDAQKAAEEAIDKFSGDKGELVFDFGPRQPEEKAVSEAEKLRAQAKDLRAQADFKTVTGDEENAAALRTQADALETQADAIEQAKAMEDARRAAQEAVQETAEQENTQEAAQPEEAEPLVDENGELDENAFAKAVDEIARDAQEAVRSAADTVSKAAEEAADYIVRDAKAPVSGRQTFPAAGLHDVDIQVDADDVRVELADSGEIETIWSAQNADGEPVVTLSGHTLSIRRKNPDVFKTFFSVFAKTGGEIIVCVPRGYAANYKISTTSGDVHIGGVDVDDVKITTTSGSVRVEPDTHVRCGDIGVTTVSGHATVSACADDIAVTTVSGNQFISCDAHKVDVNVVSGSVHVEGACDDWEIEAVSSDVELLCTVAPTKKVKISSMHGTVRLALPDEIRGFVAETNGALGCEIFNEFGPNRYGTCALPIRMDTLHGKLMITRL